MRADAGEIRLRGLEVHMQGQFVQRVGSLVCAEAARHILIVSASAFLSLGGVSVAAFSLHDPSHGGRGGAVASAASLLALFANKPYGLRFLESATRRQERIDRLGQLSGPDKAHTTESDRLKNHVQAIRTTLLIDVLGQQIQNRSIAWSASIGTIFWGYGDIFAQWLMDLDASDWVLSSAQRNFFLGLLLCLFLAVIMRIVRLTKTGLSVAITATLALLICSVWFVPKLPDPVSSYLEDIKVGEVLNSKEISEVKDALQRNVARLQGEIREVNENVRKLTPDTHNLIGKELEGLRVVILSGKGATTPALYDNIQFAPIQCPAGWMNASGDGPGTSAHYIRITMPFRKGVEYGYLYRICYRLE